ncbi:PD-(D/E)XK nuclease family protein [Pontixanthobacter sp.]|uniref:PD-(D/E)XK nuclease family protein n=1 Tax=Pontixanthobacter sp. TaxID=2792078 RepID=UPI003C7E6AB7
MADAAAPSVYSIAAHRGFADALVAGLVPRYADPDFGLAQLTLLLPSSRAIRAISEAFIRHYGANGHAGLLMPRMVAVGDLDLVEALGPLLDPLGATDIPRAIDPTHRWLRLAQLLAQEQDDEAPAHSIVLRQARDITATMDRLLVEDIAPADLLDAKILGLREDLAQHWQDSLHLFAKVQVRWHSELAEQGALDAAARRNRLFDFAARQWTAAPPANPIVAAGVTSASPALARLLKVVSQLPDSSVVLPDLDLALDDTVWEELGAAGDPQSGAGHAGEHSGEAEGAAVFGKGDAVTHPQYHLKLLLNRMGIARGEVQQWHRRGLSAAPPERSYAISNVFLPPEASKSWVGLPPEKRRLSGVQIIESTGPEEEAQAVALLVRQALETPERRVNVVTPDRGLAQRIVQHLRRWHIEADDSAGRELSATPAGRVLLLLAEIMELGAAPVPLMALLEHPLVNGGQQRGVWLGAARAFELALRGPRKEPGLAALNPAADKAQVAKWWQSVSAILQPIVNTPDHLPLSETLDLLRSAAESLCGNAVWSREDGRALAAMIDDVRRHAQTVGTVIEPQELRPILRDVMDNIAVRPPYGGHPRVAIFGLLEARMSRADLVICAGLNEGSWPGTPATDPLLAPPVLRALGVPGADFRIGLAAHDLAGALGAPQVVLSRAERDISGPTIASRFLLRIKALLGDDQVRRIRDTDTLAWARALDAAAPAERYPVPMPLPSPEQRKQKISVTALDRLRSDPYQFYARSILNLPDLDALDAEPSPAWQGILAHEILQRWHETGGNIAAIADDVLRQINAHPLMRALWQPRLMRALEWVQNSIAAADGRTPALIEEWGRLTVKGVEIFGKADRIDRLPDGRLAIIDYKTGRPPSAKEVAAGYALQLGTIGLMAERGGFEKLQGQVSAFEYWSLGKSDKSDSGFGYVSSPVKTANNKSKLDPEDFLPMAEKYLHDALDAWILGAAPFTARANPDAKVYNTYDQLMRLDEWMGREQ